MDVSQQCNQNWNNLLFFIRFTHVILLSNLAPSNCTRRVIRRATTCPSPSPCFDTDQIQTRAWTVAIIERKNVGWKTNLKQCFSSLLPCVSWSACGDNTVITLNHGSPITSLDATVHIAAGPQRGSRRGLEQSQQHSVHTLLGVVFGIAQLARNLQGRKTMSGFGFQSITTKKT